MGVKLAPKGNFGHKLFVTIICHNYLSQLFVTIICHNYLSQLFVTIICHNFRDVVAPLKRLLGFDCLRD
jgi:hypothetical protein